MTNSSILKKSPAVGIDLGTTYSAVAYLDDMGRPVTMVNSEGDLATPSVVLFDGDTTVIGKEAIKAVATEAEHVAQCAKRDLGERAFHRVIEGRRYPPEAIQAWVLNKIKRDAERQLGPLTASVVITVPAYFDEVRRKATQDAGYMAGLEVIDIINEPTAAAMAFGFQQGFLNREGGANKPQKLLVYDLGGGTFDVTVMEIRGDEFLALATDGDVQLGGQDWDQRLVDYVAEEFMRKHNIDPREDPNTAGRLWREAKTPSARSRPHEGLDQLATTKAQAVRAGDHAREIRRDHARPARSHAVHHPANVAGGRAAVGTTSIACCWWAVRPACRWSRRMLQRSCRARSPTPRWRRTRRSLTARRCMPGSLLAKRHGEPLAFQALRTSTRTAWAWSASTAKRAASAMPF